MEEKEINKELRNKRISIIFGFLIEFILFFLSGASIIKYGIIYCIIFLIIGIIVAYSVGKLIKKVSIEEFKLKTGGK